MDSGIGRACPSRSWTTIVQGRPLPWIFIEISDNRSFKFKMGFGIGFVTMKEMFSTTFKPLSNHFYRGYNHWRNHSLTNDNMNTYIIISLIKYIHEYS